MTSRSSDSGSPERTVFAGEGECGGGGVGCEGRLEEERRGLAWMQPF